MSEQENTMKGSAGPNEEGDAERIKLLQEKIEYLQRGLPEIYQEHLLWRGCTQMPFGTVRPHIVTKGNCVFIGGGNSGKMEFTRSVMKYDIVEEKWSTLPISPYYTFGLVVVKGLLTLIGGTSVITASVSNAVTCYDEQMGKWVVKFPPMPTQRCAVSAVSTASHVVAVGGISDYESAYLDVVEVLDLTSMEWSRACPFPIPVSFMSITACSITGTIFLLGGLSQEGAVRSVYSCTLGELVASSSKTDIEQGTDSVWQIATKALYNRSGGAAISGKLVTASGIDENGEVTTAVHSFNPLTKTWSKHGEMPSARSSCSIAVCPGGQILIAGGYFKPRNWIGSLTKDVMMTVNLKE